MKTSDLIASVLPPFEYTDANLEQGSDAWRAARVGSLGASQVHEAIARTKTGWGATRANVMAAIILERITGKAADNYVSPAMEWGSRVEPDARAAYEFQNNCDVQLVGLIRHPAIAGSHASPDGLVGHDGLIEVKCPNSATHLDTLLGQSVPGKYNVQMQWQMAVTGRQWCDWISYDPRFAPHLQLYVHRVNRDDKLIGELETMVSDFLQEVETKIAALDKIYGQRRAA